MRKLKLNLLLWLANNLSSGVSGVGGRLYRIIKIDGLEFVVRSRFLDAEINLSREEMYQLKGLIKQQEERQGWVTPEYKGDVQHSISVIGLHI